ncbi:histone acetyltransferase 1 [Marchantia polymorpha subsp. ruderalis]|uniref:histone acetyltransferase n=1 Tax=Marchantia polymorpha TaxID=3197 RepID=A0A2R6WKY1_MARPO|nr:hypothetical protein MARPO_0079s0005 [Marchantia polymorpha]BBN20058.1 hypothetical protein Mp_8g16090 [Marchantia polymorpha subsp. ruderalis]|eukprot:PTQ34495.1 hypothetical protein MARPO_0079s0005 [Marchantia polymorpha]
MASGGKMKALLEAGPEERVKRRKVAFAAIPESVVSCNANECMKLLFVSSAQDMQDESQREEIMCDPQFAERIFGEDGTIYGYEGLEIDLWLQSNTFHAYVDIRFIKKVEGGKNPPTDIWSQLKKVFGDSMTDDREAFVSSLTVNSLAFEKMIKEKSEAVTKPWRIGCESADESVADKKCEVIGDEISEKSGQIVRMELTDPTVRAWHKRLNPLSLFYIEGARPIEDDDPLWEVYLALEIHDDRRKIMGFCNVYRFYHYPDSTRLRISQILVLPLYQGMGYGLHLLEAVNDTAVGRGCYDVTMEEPSINLQKLRDTMDILRLLSIPSQELKAQVEDAISDGIQRLHSRKVPNSSRPEVPEVEAASAGSSNGFRGKSSHKLTNGVKERSLLDPPKQLRDQVRNLLKINKKQFKRCWEQLLFLHLDPQDKDLQDMFQSGLIQRLNSELFGKDKELEKQAGKQIFDTENEYDSSKTFVMVRVKSKTGQVPSFETDGRSTEPAAEDKVKALQESLSEREEELYGVARDVARHCHRLGIAIPTIEHWTKPEAQNVDENSSGSSSPM